jgi:hypothetical protein
MRQPMHGPSTCLFFEMVSLPPADHLLIERDRGQLCLLGDAA